MIYAAALIWNIFIYGITLYLIFFQDASPWWIILPILFTETVTIRNINKK